MATMVSAGLKVYQGCLSHEELAGILSQMSCLLLLPCPPVLLHCIVTIQLLNLWDHECGLIKGPERIASQCW